ncbi:MAG: glutamate-5-semialdehyde dehydrogenase [Lachnospiraceae bacterium]|nr:glutamate-5-semialdehyde dehydrogenase [Lachnospiraceae bacterium]
MNIQQEAHQMKLVAPKLANTTVAERNSALEAIGTALQKHRDEIFAANQEDLQRAKADGISEAVYKRLKFNEEKLAGVIAGISQLIELPDPIGAVQLHRQLDEGLIMKRISCPIGVIGVIFEARPDALVQISTLCIKSGNCAILKGGKETVNTNAVLFRVIEEAAVAAGLPKGCLLQATLHNEIDELLSCDKDVDLLIPRGSNAFVQYIMNHTRIPVMGHADGVCHIYVDAAADLQQALPILVDAKTQYTAACNAVETILVHRSVAAEFLPQLRDAMTSAGVHLRGTKDAMELMYATAGYPHEDVMVDEDFHREYLDLIASVKLVDSVEEAVNHINQYGSHHTDCILTKDDAAADYFMAMVDSAGVYRNISTRFADGFRYGFGAEVGISTSKLHARGPVGLEGLVTYKYEITGDGHIVGDYASGKKDFHFLDL